MAHQQEMIEKLQAGYAEMEARHGPNDQNAVADDTSMSQADTST